MIKVLFVCLGNICRSPTAHGVFRNLVELHGLSHAIDIDSAGTLGYHAGTPPDQRSQAVAMQNGVDISDLQARQVTLDDFVDFDYVVAMDQENLRGLLQMQPRNAIANVSLLLAHSEQYRGQEVPDPYYGGSGGFDAVFAMVEDGCAGLLALICQAHEL